MIWGIWDDLLYGAPHGTDRGLVPILSRPTLPPDTMTRQRRRARERREREGKA